MENVLTFHPATSFIMDYRQFQNQFQNKKDKWIGLGCSLSAHLCLLLLAGIVLIKPIEFGVDAGLSGMEVELVAGSDEMATEPIEVPEAIEPPPIVQEIKDEMITEPVKEIPKPVEEQLKNTQLGNSSINAAASSGAQMQAQPSYLSNPAPRYPVEARRKGWEGTVILEASVNKSGYPVSVEIKTSSGHVVLDEAALNTVKTWRFRPAQLGNLAVESSIRVPVRFDLENP